MKTILPVQHLLMVFAITVGFAVTVNAQGSAAKKTTSQQGAQGSATTGSSTRGSTQKQQKLATATFGGGCFWCTEAVFLKLKGVHSVQSGYMGGHVTNPTYEQICTKTTGHIEVIQIQFDPQVVRFDDLLKVHLKTHDPTSWDKQGHDEGPQYRSAIFYHNDAQKSKAETYKKKLNEEKVFGRPIVTAVQKASKFWPAEDYHQNYYQKNPNSSYCNFWIPQKLAKLNEIFGDKVKPTGSAAKGRPATSPSGN